MKNLNHWILGHSMLIIVGTGGYYWKDWFEPYVFFFLASFFLLYFLARPFWLKGQFLGGLPNWVTWIRVACLVVLVHFRDLPSGTWLTLVALLEVGLDVVDGYLARRLGLQSPYGEYFDKETDAVYVMTVSIILHHRGIAGAWILWLGLIRYAYALVDYAVKPVKQKESRTTYGRFIAGIVMIGLALSFAMPGSVNQLLLPALGLLLGYSFGRSFRDLYNTTEMTIIRK